MQPLQCVLQHDVTNPHLPTHMRIPHGNIHAAIPLRSVTHDSKSPYNCAQTNAAKAAWSHNSTAAKKNWNARPAPAARARYLSSPAGATWHEKIQNFVPGLSQNEAHARSMQPLQCILQHDVTELQFSTHMTKQHGNIHAASPQWYPTKDSLSV